MSGVARGVTSQTMSQIQQRPVHGLVSLDSARGVCLRGSRAPQQPHNGGALANPIVEGPKVAKTNATLQKSEK